MSELGADERDEILKSAPRGTWALLLLMAALLLAGWLALYFGRFLAQGPVN